ncbi:CDP-diacylglycerol--glycerol-3-phosphate 3-phosphatidyltransferase [Hypnocyclicus thermotrophus]|uniref:CDP-diacylglycerol--glycerol-3-phosphate 3-phosphatidyltransferase n=1 Tax=Hypnocyclicus thermotrophus TaxID=1627895 RepID=A0AA46DZR8_9FUSO|nr:CDP-diacylglycerol--glycerol-3-phosphate 3-phosphatidyltransferase [Hypnocyclicus thermotrophus]TDT71900.1 CDP-diacylglycerol--glycerol-3-phosphate 3-phosphatidyltransferase [Hypnocyclicus thermotrophus]
MNIANFLTIFRIILIIPFIYYLKIPNNEYTAFIIFTIASITDFLDGYIARKYNLITDFGKLMDPLADKILVFSALIIFVELKYIPSWMVIVILTRDFLINGIRNLAASKGAVIAAGMSGKIKTTTQMIAILIIVLLGNSNISEYIMYIPVFFTVYSGLEYIVKSKKYFL